MKRREFITLLGGAAAAWPVTARAQQAGETRRIGVLMGYAASDREGQAYVVALQEGLQTLGWSEDRNIRIDTRWGALDAETIQRLAKELVRAAAQPHYCAKYTHYYGAAATNAHHPNHFRARC